VNFPGRHANGAFDFPGNRVPGKSGKPDETPADPAKGPGLRAPGSAGRAIGCHL